VASVAQAYVVLRQLDLQLALAKCQVRVKEQALEIARMRFQGGEIAEMDVEQALASYETSISSLSNLEGQIPKQENLLCVLLGRNPGPIPRGNGLQQLTLPKTVPTGLPEDLLTRRPDIRKAEDKLRAANANIGVARAAFFPQVNLSGLWGANNLKLYNLFEGSSEIWTLGGSFLQTLFSGGALLGQLHVTEAQKKEMVFSYEQSVLTALREVNDGLVGLKKAKEIYAAEEAKVQALRDYLQLIWYRYTNGQVEYQEVLSAEVKVFTAEESLAKAQADQFLVLVELYKSLGGGWVTEEDQQVHLQQGS
ncbi:MAG: efflux transporter outer membrane subunit, partial [Chlamydiae bacterium]|nr:efflux transporter outer membrane subunit [Chlamydiota bacterium]